MTENFIRSFCPNRPLYKPLVFADIHIPINIHTQDNAERRHNREHDRSAIRDKRQRNTHHGEHAQHHGNVDKDIKEVVASQTNGNKFAKIAITLHGKRISISNNQ